MISMMATGLITEIAMGSAGGPPPGPLPAAPFVVGILGQSQPNYLLDTRPFYRQIPQPALNDGNVTTYTGANPTRLVVNQSAVAGGLVNPAIAAWSAFFARLLPTREIVIVDLCEGGTGRNQLMNDADTARNWSDLTTTLAAVRQDYDDLDLIVECWMANDVATARTMGPEWSPFYIGQRWGGEAFTLGTANPDSTRNPTIPVDHCLWDIEAAPDQFGRGVFKRARTKLSLVGWPTFNAASAGEAEMLNFTDREGYPTQADRPARDSLSEMFNDPRFQTFAGYDGFSSHIARMREANGVPATHPDPINPDGQISMGWPYAAAILRGTGYGISEPTIEAITGPDDGSYADITVDLPNGGDLSTLRKIRTALNKTPTKAEVAALWSDRSLTGHRVPDAHLKVVGVDPLPAGVVYDAANKRVIVPTDVIIDSLSGWDFSDAYFELRGTITNGIFDNLFTTRTGQPTVTLIDIYTTAVIGDIHHNTFQGAGYLNRAIGSLINQRFTEAPDVTSDIGNIHANHFSRFPTDCLKLASGTQVHGNYFDVPATLKSTPVAYDPAATYGTDDPVFVGPREYVSLVDGNLGNAPSGDRTDTAFWRHTDPHSDVINPRAVIGGTLEIWGNFLNMAPSIRQDTASGEPWGMTNGIRMDRNSGSAVEHGEIHAHHNIIATDGPTAAVLGHSVLYPVSMGNDDDPAWVPNRLENNWITPGNNDRYTYEDDTTENPLTPNIVSGNDDYDPATAAASAAPHQQQVTGFEVTTAGTRRPVYRENATTYPASHRGRVVIVDTGSGTPRKGVVRIIPETPFAFGAGIDYLRGDASAVLQEPRDTDAELFKDMLIEHVPALYDGSATYPMDGIPVRPMPPSLPVPVAAPSFTARSATFAQGAYLSGTNLSVPATGQGLLSMWFRNDLATWEQLDQLIELRVGTTDVFNLRTNSSSRMRFDLGASVASFHAGPTSATPFEAGTWYHLMAAWDDTALTIYMNGVEVASQTITTPAMAGGTITRAAFVDRLNGGASFTGEVGHLYLNLSETLDLSVAANREKFALNGAPVDLGAAGANPTGTQPAFYFDGDGAAWNNQGSSGALPLVGTLMAGGSPSF